MRNMRIRRVLAPALIVLALVAVITSVMLVNGQVAAAGYPSY